MAKKKEEEEPLAPARGTHAFGHSAAQGMPSSSESEPDEDQDEDEEEQEQEEEDAEDLDEPDDDLDDRDPAAQRRRDLAELGAAAFAAR